MLLRRETTRLYPVDEAWKLYPPVGISSGEKDINYGFLNDFTDVYSDAAETAVSLLINDTEERLLAGLYEKPRDHRIRNSLAVLYAKFGMYGRAEKELKTILQQHEMLSARVNLANLYFLMGEWDSAEKSFLLAREKISGETGRRTGPGQGEV